MLVAKIVALAVGSGNKRFVVGAQVVRVRFGGISTIWKGFCRYKPYMTASSNCSFEPQLDFLKGRSRNKTIRIVHPKPWVLIEGTIDQKGSRVPSFDRWAVFTRRHTSLVYFLCENHISDKSREASKNAVPSLPESLLYKIESDLWRASGSRASSVSISDISKNCDSVDENRYEHEEASDVIVMRVWCPA